VTSSPDVHSDGSPLVRLHIIDPTTGVITTEVHLGNGVTELIGGGASSYAALALGDESVWVKADYENIVFRIDRSSFGVSETLRGIAGGSSDVSPGLTVGAGAVWATAPEAVTYMSLKA
jgi:hypothetical protein